MPPPGERPRGLLHRGARCLLAAALVWVSPPVTPGQNAPPAFTNLAPIRALPPGAGATHQSFDLRAVVTYSDPEWRVLFVQDGPAAAFVSPDPSHEALEYKLMPGQVVELQGNLAPGLVHCNLADQSFRVLGEAPMPAALELDGPPAFCDDAEGRWVRFTGWVVQQGNLGNRITLGVWVSPERCVTLVLRGMDPALAESLYGALVEATGVLGLRVDGAGQKTGDYLLLARTSDAVRKLKELPVLSPAQCLAERSALSPREPVRVRGILDQRPALDGFIVRESTNSACVPLACRGPVTLVRGTPVEAFGFPSGPDRELVLTNAFVRTAPGERTRPNSAPAKADPRLGAISQIIQVRALSVQEASRGHPVQVSGVLTFCDPQHQVQFIQDDTAGIYLNLTRMPTPPELVPGQALEVTGFTGPGEYAPVIVAQTIRVRQPRCPFPTPHPASGQMLLTGTEDSQWVSLRGVVQRQEIERDQSTTLWVATGDGRIRAHLPPAEAESRPAGLVDAAVEVHGVCRTVFNERRQLESVAVEVPYWSEVQVTESAPPNAFELPVRTVGELFQFHAGSSGLHRAHLRGQALLRQPDGSWFLQDDTGGIRVQSVPAEVVPTGAVLEVTGFPALVGGLPVLQEPTVRVTSHPSRSVRPTSLMVDAALDEAFHATLVRLDGRVLEHSSHGGGDILTLEFGSLMIDALLDRPLPDPPPPGSRVRVTGVYAARLDDDHKLHTFQVLLRSPADVAILSRPSWWSARHAAWVLGGLGGGLFLALAWIGLLRKQVQRQTLELREDIAERRRMEAQLQKGQQDLLETSRQAGMAEVATSVLHNVGNVLNSINTSAALVSRQVRNFNPANLARAAALLRSHETDLGAFLTLDPKGRQFTPYLETLAQHLAAEKAGMLEELTLLGRNIEHVNEIVALQQNYARVSGLLELVPLTELVENALLLHRADLEQHGVEVRREFASLAPMLLDKHKVLQILVNLVSNAKHACLDARRPDKRLTLRVAQADGRVRVCVADNGVGIARENLTRVFNYGFTTRKAGHGFGLHSGALAAKELGGSLTLTSDGPDTGATATLELPYRTDAA